MPSAAEEVDPRCLPPGAVETAGRRADALWRLPSTSEVRSLDADEHLAWLSDTAAETLRSSPSGRAGLLMTHYERDLQQDEMGVWPAERVLAGLRGVRLGLLTSFRKHGATVGAADQQELSDLATGGYFALPRGPGIVSASLDVRGPDLRTDRPLPPGGAPARWPARGTLDPSLLTRAIGLAPSSEIHPAPQPPGSRPTYRQVGEWTLDSHGRLASRTLEDHIKWLLDALWPVRAQLYAFVDAHDLSVTVDAFVTAPVKAFNAFLSAGALARLDPSMCRLTLAVSLWPDCSRHNNNGEISSAGGSGDSTNGSYAYQEVNNKAGTDAGEPSTITNGSTTTSFGFDDAGNRICLGTASPAPAAPRTPTSSMPPGS